MSVDSLIDLENERFGTMLVVGPAEAAGYWWLLCECNEAFAFSTEELAAGATCPPCSMPEVIDLREGQTPTYQFAHLPTEWMRDAACATSQLDFTPDSEAEMAQALEFCGTCPVKDECLNWALESFDNWAVLGGTTPDQRAAMRKELGIKRPRRKLKRRGLPRGWGSGVRHGTLVTTARGGGF